MSLTIDTGTVHTVQASDLETYIREFILKGKNTSGGLNVRFGTRTEYVLVVNVHGQFDGGYDLAQWQDFKAGIRIDGYRLQSIMNGMCRDGHIPKGVYLVHSYPQGLFRGMPTSLP